MPDIFLSYNRKDQSIARRFAEGFERAGFSVWWDQTLRSGEAYDKVTEKALDDAKAVVVLWSKESVESRWVRAEATQADRNGTLVPVMIEACKRPIMFELTHTADLIGWKGDEEDPAWLAYVSDVRRFVNGEAGAQLSRTAPTPRRSRFRIGIAALAAILIAGAGLFWALEHGAGKPAESADHKAAVALAVVPFENPDGNEQSRVLAFGIAESVQHQLASLQDLSVISWSSASGVDKSQNIREISKQLNVAYVLQGSVLTQGKLLRVSARLVDTATERNVWSLRLERQQQDMFAIQDEIATQVTRALSVSVSPEGRQRMLGQGTRNIEAYLAFLEGQDALSTWRAVVAGKAAEHFNRALQLDPKFARAMVMLARARQRDAEYSAGPDQRGKLLQARTEADELINSALELDPTLSEAYVERGDLRLFERPEEAEGDYRKAIELSPNNARAHQQLASFLWEDPARRREPEIVQSLERARTLDPLDPEQDINLAVYLFYEFGKAEEASQILRRVLERQPDYSPALQRLGEVLLMGQGSRVEVIRLFEKALALDGNAEIARRFLVTSYVAIGDFGTAQKLAEDPRASLVCRLILAHGQHRTQEAARLAYQAFQDDLITGADQGMAVKSIVLEALRSKDYGKASIVLEDLLSIYWMSPTEPVLGPNRGLTTDIITYAGMLREAGQLPRAQALIRAAEKVLEEQVARTGESLAWTLSSWAGIAAFKGDKETALGILERQCNGPNALCWGVFELDPLFLPLHGEPRFKVLAATLKRNQEAARMALRTSSATVMN